MVRFAWMFMHHFWNTIAMVDPFCALSMFRYQPSIKYSTHFIVGWFSSLVQWLDRHSSVGYDGYRPRATFYPEEFQSFGCQFSSRIISFLTLLFLSYLSRGYLYTRSLVRFFPARCEKFESNRNTKIKQSAYSPNVGNWYIVWLKYCVRVITKVV